jgi:hypothetical protein
MAEEKAESDAKTQDIRQEGGGLAPGITRGVNETFPLKLGHVEGRIAGSHDIYQAGRGEAYGAYVKAWANRDVPTLDFVSIVDATGNPIQMGSVGQISQGSTDVQEETLYINLKAEDFKALNSKTTEVLTEAALAYERIAKDQEEIERLKTETRAMLGRLRAA